ncbi:MAG: hypothetical protein ABEH88_07450 [Halobacteriales archaeon]
MATTTVSVGFPNADTQVATGSTATVPVTVTNATNGVGSFELTVEVINTDVARIENVTVSGNPTFVTREFGPTGRNVSIAAAGVTHDGPNPAVATVRVNGIAEGSTTLEVSATSVGDSDGASYHITPKTTSSTVTVVATTVSNQTAETSRAPGNGSGGEDDTSGLRVTPLLAGLALLGVVVTTLALLWHRDAL